MFVFWALYLLFTYCEVTNGIKIFEIYKMDVTTRFAILKCTYPENFTLPTCLVVYIWPSNFIYLVVSVYC